MRTILCHPKVPPTLRPSDTPRPGRQERRVVEEVQCDRAMKTENFIVDPSHVEAGGRRSDLHAKSCLI